MPIAPVEMRLNEFETNLHCIARLDQHRKKMIKNEKAIKREKMRRKIGKGVSE